MSVTGTRTQKSICLLTLKTLTQIVSKRQRKPHFYSSAFHCLTNRYHVLSIVLKTIRSKFNKKFTALQCNTTYIGYIVLFLSAMLNSKLN